MQHAAFSQWHRIPLNIHADSVSYYFTSSYYLARTDVGEVHTFPIKFLFALVPWALLRSSTTHSLLSLLKQISACCLESEG